MSPLVKTKQSFYITEINRQRKRVVGSIRQIQQEARKAAAEKIWNTIEIGNEYDGVVKSLTSYGAFVYIGGVDGMDTSPSCPGAASSTRPRSFPLATRSRYS